MSIPGDVQEFLDGYPDQRISPGQQDNYKFYSNKLRSQPDNLLIDEIHDRWFGKYRILEQNHGFIQWLFPIREYGMNYKSQPLQPQEIVVMKADQQIINRVLKSYQLMLDFYGMQLSSAETGLLKRSEPLDECARRYKNLTSSMHNYLRISRILKSLSEFGLEHLNAGFLLHVLNEQSEFQKLNTRALRSSMDRWWANCVRNDFEREWIGETIQGVRSGEVTFTRQEYEDALQRKASTGNLA